MFGAMYGIGMVPHGNCPLVLSSCPKGGTQDQSVLKKNQTTLALLRWDNLRILNLLSPVNY